MKLPIPFTIILDIESFDDSGVTNAGEEIRKKMEALGFTIRIPYHILEQPIIAELNENKKT